jgi:hypothetical protein
MHLKGHAYEGMEGLESVVGCKRVADGVDVLLLVCAGRD